LGMACHVVRHALSLNGRVIEVRARRRQPFRKRPGSLDPDTDPVDLVSRAIEGTCLVISLSPLAFHRSDKGPRVATKAPEMSDRSRRARWVSCQFGAISLYERHPGFDNRPVSCSQPSVVSLLTEVRHVLRQRQMFPNTPPSID
jgi:hypothetical protein